MNSRQKKIIADAHLDLLKDVQYKREAGRRKVIETDYLPLFRAGGVNVVVSSIFVDSQFLPEMGMKRGLNQIARLYEELDESGQYFALCTSYSQILQALEADKVAILLSFEGTEPLSDDVSLLRLYYELGVRMVGFTWSRRNLAADGSYLRDLAHGQPGGLSAFGVQVLRLAEELGMILDVSHLNDIGAREVLQMTRGGVIASHSDCRGIVDIERNLSDDMLQAIAAQGGVIGVNAINFLSTLDDSKNGILIMADQIDYIRNLVGIDHVGFGFDLCDMIAEYQSPQLVNGLARRPFDVLRSYAEVPELLAELKERGYSEQERDKVSGLNFMRIYAERLQ